MNTNIQKVQKEISTLNTDFKFFEKRKFNLKLEDFSSKLKVISTLSVYNTWGIVYVKIPIEVLKEFGIESNKPFVSFLSFRFLQPSFSCFFGEIFEHDMFDVFKEYKELAFEDYYNHPSFTRVKLALENYNVEQNLFSFFQYYNIGDGQIKNDLLVLSQDEVQSILRFGVRFYR